MTGVADTPRWVPPGIIAVSPEALAYGREFHDTVKGRPDDWIVAFGWGDSVSVKDAPDTPYRDVGACLVLGAYRREQVPTAFIQMSGDLEFVIEIPRQVWESAPRRVIEMDDSLWFRLALR